MPLGANPRKRTYASIRNQSGSRKGTTAIRSHATHADNAPQLKQAHGRRGGKVDRVTTPPCALNSFGRSDADFINKASALPTGAPYGLVAPHIPRGRMRTRDRESLPWSAVLRDETTGISGPRERTRGRRPSHPSPHPGRRNAESGDLGQGSRESLHAGHPPARFFGESQRSVEGHRSRRGGRSETPQPARYEFIRIQVQRCMRNGDTQLIYCSNK